jgi:hypothetical protein
MIRLRLKQATLVLGAGLLCGWMMITPRGKPPGTVFTVQLDPVYRPVGSRTIHEKTYNESWLVRGRTGGRPRVGLIRYKPRKIQLTCDRPINAYLIDLSNISDEELVALNTHPDARMPGVNPKPLAEYPMLRKSTGQKQVVWSLDEGWWGRCSYRLLIDCPQDPRASVEVRIDYGGKDYDFSH